MKRLYVLCLLTCIFASNMAINAMDDEYEIHYIPQHEPAISLKKLCVKSITSKFENLLKKAVKKDFSTRDLDLDEVRSYVQEVISENVADDIKEMIRMDILTKSVRKAFTTYHINTLSLAHMLITQHFDGTQTSISERSNTPFEYRLKSSPWYTLRLEDLANNYCMTYYSKKHAQAHPFISLPFTIEAGPTPGPVTPGPDLIEDLEPLTL